MLPDLRESTGGFFAVSRDFGRVSILDDVFVFVSGVSAYADPHTYKLRTRVVHIWDNRSRQPNRSAMEGPPAGGTAFLFFINLIVFTIKTGGV